jgi:DNA-binding MarR family transcriptional regulator
MQKPNDAYQIVWLTRRLFRALAQKSNDSLKNLDITVADRAVLEFLYPDEKLSVPEIAQRYQVSRQHVQVTVNGLLESGNLATKSNPRHKRSPLIALTSKGRALFRKIRKRDTNIVNRIFAEVPEIDRRVTQKTLETLLAQLNGL